MLRPFFSLFLVSIFLSFFSSGPSAADPLLNPGLLKKRWEARWINCPAESSRDFGVYHFRRTFSLGQAPAAFVIHVTADNRYVLFVNGHRIAAGPARGDLNQWRYETLDLAPYLRAGRNTLAAVVWNYAQHAPMAQMKNETGFLLQGNGALESPVNSGKDWKVIRNRAIEAIPVDMQKMMGYYVAGPGEKLTGSLYPWGWERPDFDDSAWASAAELAPGTPRGIQDSPSRWMLVPRNIPLMEEKTERLPRVVRSRGIEVPADFLEGKSPWTIPAHTRASVLLDQTRLTTAYPELVARGGRGSSITLTYAEALWQDGKKGPRHETEGREILGYQDQFLPDGGAARLFRPLWWRTYRYLQLDIETGEEALVLEDLRGLFTAYPFQRLATFESDDPSLKPIWEIGWHTARLCAHETYMDCPYYEQLQYGGDTRLQSLISLYLTGDARLVKNAIQQLNDSRIPDGITQSRYPSELPQLIPPFSLIWIGMVHDLWWYQGEADFVRQQLPGIRTILGWFESRLSTSGLLGELEWWNFVDWTGPFTDGVPPQQPDGQSTILSLQFAGALRHAAELERVFGNPENSRDWLALASRITQSVRDRCWDPARGLLADTPARQTYSQQGNALAVLEDAIPASQAVPVLEKILQDPRITQCSFYFRFYLFRAMKKAGLADRYLEQLKPWKEMVALGLTTWAENPEPTRSDCHAWSSHPNFDLLATVAGIESDAPGFQKVVIEPHPGHLKEIRASLPHPQGELRMELIAGGKQWQAKVCLPGTLTGRFLWKGQEVGLKPGEQQFQLAK